MVCIHDNTVLQQPIGDIGSEATTGLPVYGVYMAVHRIISYDYHGKKCMSTFNWKCPNLTVIQLM